MNIKLFLYNLKKILVRRITILIVLFLIVISICGWYIYSNQQQSENYQNIAVNAQKSEQDLKQQLTNITKQLEDLKNEDQIVKNKNLEEEIKNINSTYSKAVNLYEKNYWISKIVDKLKKPT